MAALYEAHFGLSPRPFGESSSPDSYVPLASHEAALRRLQFGLEHGRGPGLLFGASGAGKTLIARTLARDLGQRVVHLTFPAMPAADLLCFLADELDAPPGDPSLAGSVRRVQKSLAKAAREGLRPLLVVDEAHLIDDTATFEALRLLLNFTTEGQPDLSLLIVGGPEVLLQMPPALSDRLTARALLGPLTREESSAYVTGRLAAAGANEPLFDAPTLTELHFAADGLPRRINRLADLALLIAFAESRPRPDARSVEIAVREAAFEPIGV